ncbi:MAG: phosphoglucosamine mutase [candidate division Zixibacteria bacterium RBG_16_53_22]|nr:MAG: phosphoglucosamine mutase [candidate division Zixibacteria bacterium RBG_16_53_22]
MNHKLLVSVSGVRGVVGSALTADVALRYASAFGTFLKSGKVAVGGDTRRTGPMVRAAAVAGLMATGHDVVDIGICPTPTIELAVRDGGFAGGIAVTASHNPDQYNALKLIGKGGLFLSALEAEKVNSLYEDGDIKAVNWQKVGKLESDYKWIDHHIDKILLLDIISPTRISQRQLRVVVDCVGATASVMAARFFSCLGVKFHLINSQIGDRFPHPPEPLPENLSELGRAVRDIGADVGLAFDPDSDRLAIVSEEGEPLGEEYTLALGCRYILTQVKGPIAVNVSSSLLNDFVAREAGTRAYRAKVGERNVTEKLMRIKGIAGGEGNGGLIYPKLHWGRDGFLAAAVILQYLASTEKRVSQLAAELPAYVMLKTKMPGSRRDIERRKGKIRRIFPEAKIDNLDGIKISGDDWWVQIRASNTEPILRLMAEADSETNARKLISVVKSVFSN